MLQSQHLCSQRTSCVALASLKPSAISQLKTDFVTQVNHEFRTPLTVIATATELLKLYHSQISDQKRQQYFQQIQEAIKQLIHLLETALTDIDADL
jgi:signal transduction histidine kinase